jgi:protein phosphatase
MAGTVETTQFESGAVSHVGKVRTRNEDSYLVQPESGIWAVADGMGGHDDGHVASATVIEELRSIGCPASAADLLARCEEGLVSANDRLYRLARNRGGATIGTTVAILLTHGGYFGCLWCGDSRIYQLRAGELTQLSRDHTEVQAMLEDGRLTPEEATHWPHNVITRAIGVYERPELEMEQGTLVPDDVFLICSDGLTGHVTDMEIRAALLEHNCQLACDVLVEQTLERGARDNVTVIAVRYRPANVVVGRDKTILEAKPESTPARDTPNRAAPVLAEDVQVASQTNNAG